MEPGKNKLTLRSHMLRIAENRCGFADSAKIFLLRFCGKTQIRMRWNFSILAEKRMRISNWRIIDIYKNGTVEKLIISIRFQELLFNKSHKDHHNKIQLVKAWEQVSRETGLSGRLNSKHSLDIFIALTIYLIFLLFGLFASFFAKGGDKASYPFSGGCSPCQ